MRSLIWSRAVIIMTGIVFPWRLSFCSKARLLPSGKDKSKSARSKLPIASADSAACMFDVISTTKSLDFKRLVMASARSALSSSRRILTVFFRAD